MRPGFLILAAVLWPKSTISAEDGRVAQALPEIARLASAFWHSAPDYMSQETLNQKALTLPKRRLRIGASAAEPPHPEFAHREIVSYYALSSFRAAPEALHEFREILSVDGQTATVTGRGKLRIAIDTQNDNAKKALLAEFEKTSLAVAATDFGQLILLFTKAKLANYTFDSRGSGLAGADRAMVIDFRQNAGAEALHVSAPGKDVLEPLNGQIWLRELDFVPLRISLNTSRRERSKNIRDEARVDYGPRADGLVLPASVVYRRFVNDELFIECIYQYTDWQLVNRR